MALSPFEKRNSLRKIRSSSFAPNVINRFYGESLLDLGDKTLISSIKCGTFYSQNENGQTLQSTRIQVSNFLTPTYKKPKCIEWSRFRPAYTSPKRLTKRQSPIKHIKAKKALCYDVDEPELEEKKPSRKIPMTLIAAIIIGLFSIIAYSLQYKCYKFTGVKIKLENIIVGQSEAINRLAILETFEYNKKPLILVFTGPIGVGKTYTTSVVFDGFSSFSSKSDLEHSISYYSSYDMRLILKDDISLSNIYDAINLANDVTKNFVKQQNKVILIVTFRTNSEMERTLVLKTFDSEFVDYYHIPFQNLTSSDVLQCFMIEKTRLNLDVPSDQVMNLVNKQMEFIDILQNSPGCKGVTERLIEFKKQN